VVVSLTPVPVQFASLANLFLLFVKVKASVDFAASNVLQNSCNCLLQWMVATVMYAS